MIEDFKRGFYRNCSVSYANDGITSYNQLYVTDYYGNRRFQGNFVVGREDDRLAETLQNLVNTGACYR